MGIGHSVGVEPAGPRHLDMADYYEELKVLARETRKRHNLTTSSVSLSSLRQIYKQEGIRIKLWDYKLRKIRGAYIDIDGEAHVLLNKAIKPKEPRIFTMAHELKHHYIDRELAKNGQLECHDLSWSGGSMIEIGAEIFASEFVYPEAEALSLINQLGIANGAWRQEDVVRLKKSCPAPVSYAFLVKRLEWFGTIERGVFRGVKWQNLEESMYGIPFYRRKARV